MAELGGKVVLVTGAARGMGKLEAINFGREGCRVVISDVDGAELQKTSDEMNGLGLKAYPYLLNVSDRAACFELAEKVGRDVGAIDVLVNNAGVVECGDFLEMSEFSIRRMMEVNYLGQAWMMQAFVPDMVRRRSGHVVNICSSAGKVGVARLAAYCATKFAGIGLTDSVRAELRKSGVNFTIVNPGFVNTGMFEGTRVPTITSWQDPQKIADEVVTAVKKDRREIFIPRFAVHMAAFARGLGIPRLSDFANTLLGGNKSMNAWRKDPARPF